MKGPMMTTLTDYEHSTGTTQAVLTVSDLKKQFVRKGGDTFWAVDDVSLQLGRSEMVVLLGPSGCGKTTLLRCIAGLEEPDSGQVTVSGRTVYAPGEKTVAPERRNVGMMFQSYALWPHLTVRANVAYPLQARKTPAREIRTRADRILDIVGVGHLAEQHPGQLSGGQQQRVALARCLVASPDLLLFDEPLSNVDAKVRDQLRREILGMKDNLGFAGVYVTHDQDEAMRMADHLAVMDSGRIVQLGSPEDVYFNPQNFYVANFVGALNAWNTDISGSLVELAGIGRFPITKQQLGPGLSLATNMAATAIVRPESIKLTQDAGGSENVGEIVHETFAGAHSEHIVRLNTGHEITAWTSQRGATDVRQGDRVRIHIDPKRVRLVAREGGDQR